MNNDNHSLPKSTEDNIIYPTFRIKSSQTDDVWKRSPKSLESFVGKGDGGGGMEHRVTIIETQVTNINQNISEIKTDIREIRGKHDANIRWSGIIFVTILLSSFGIYNAVNKDIAYLGSEIGSVKSELGSEIGSVKSELSSEIGSVKSELSSEIGSVKSEISEMKGDIKNLNYKVDHLSQDVSNINAKLDTLISEKQK